MLRKIPVTMQKAGRAKKTKESSNSIMVTVLFSKTLLSGHIFWNLAMLKEMVAGVAGKSHIAPAEEKGILQLEEEIERSLRDG